MLLGRHSTLFLLVLGGCLLISSVNGLTPDRLASPLVAESKRNNVVAAKIDPSFHAGLVQQASNKLNPMLLENFPLLGEDGSDTVELEVVSFDVLTSDAVTVVVKANGTEETLRPSVQLVRGQVKGSPNSTVLLGFTDSGVNGFIQMEDQLYIVAEDRKQNETKNERITFVYNTAKVDMSAGKELKDKLLQSGLGSRDLQGDRCYTVAVDTLDDFLHGQSVDDKMNYAYTVMAATSLLLAGNQDSFQMYIAVGYIRVYQDGASDWYNPSSTCQDQIIDNKCLLTESRNYWRGSSAPIVPSYHVLLTLTQQCGPYGGIAWINATCSTYKYAIAGCLSGSIPLPLQSNGNSTSGIPNGNSTSGILNSTSMSGEPNNNSTSGEPNSNSTAGEPSSNSTAGKPNSNLASGTWDLVAIAHELGHVFGSTKTHNYSPAIDTCAQNCDVPDGKPIDSCCGDRNTDDGFGSINDVPPTWVEGGKCIGLIKVASMLNGKHERSPSCQLRDGNIIPISGRGAAFWDQKIENGDFKSGMTEVSGCEFVQSSQRGPMECFIPPGQTHFLSNVVNTDDKGKDGRRKLAVTTGDKTVLVVRVIAANDVTITASENELVQYVFEDSLNFAKQYTACSYGQLNFKKTNDRNLTGTNDGDETSISDGVTTVRVPDATIEDSSALETQVRAALNQNFGVTSPKYLADHVMLCMPRASPRTTAYAYINHWLSVYDDTWCHSVSGQMHEIGHNLGLAHSGEGNSEYADTSGMVSDGSILTDLFLYYRDLTHRCA